MHRPICFAATLFFIALSLDSAWASDPNDLKKPAASDAPACIPANQFAELLPSVAGLQTDAYGKTSVALGAYERISPDGRYVLRSFSGSQLGQVSLIELSADGQVLRAIRTPLANEAFPVQGSWRYLVDTNGDHYTFESIVARPDNGKNPISPLKPAHPVFRGGMRGFYATAAELPSSKSGHILIRSLSWPHPGGDTPTQGEGALVSRTIEVDTQTQRITADSGAVFHCRNRVSQDGALYALPMLSVDGQEFAALPQMPKQGAQTMRIFSFGADGTGCQATDNFDFSSGKVIFGFSQPEQPAPLVWEYQGRAFWWDRASAAPLDLTPYELAGRRIGPDFELTASAFPGITQDGRVIYGASLKDCTHHNGQRRCRDRAGYIISDPYQSNAYLAASSSSPSTQTATPGRQACIHPHAVVQVRARFEAQRKEHLKNRLDIKN